MSDDPLEIGLGVRREVLGGAHVDRALAATTDFNRDFQEYITENVWGDIWSRPGLDRKTRSMLTIGLMAALGRHEEFQLHIRATANTGVTREEVSEILLQVGAYAGVPAANSAYKLAADVYAAMDKEKA
jgi:4-carboxymuconolactone decarboxylase